MRGQNPREIAVHILRRREAGVDYVEHLLEAESSGTALSPVDRGLIQELAYGVVRWQATLDWLVDRKTKGRPQKSGLQILLRLGLYQMFWLDRIPDHAAVFETIEIAKRLGFGAQAGFINAVLRSYAREREPTRKLLEELKVQQPHLGFSHPAWLVERWTERWGTEKTRRLLEMNNTPPKNYARLNTLKNGAERLTEEWRNEGVEYDFFRRDWTGGNLIFELKSHPPLAMLKSFREGLFYVQDPSTLLAVHALEPKPGETVLDYCGAPGGKTTLIAQFMENRGRIVARDTSPERLELLKENCVRLGIACVVGELPESSSLSPSPAPHFDKVLIDAPCSNSGVMRRRVDLRWRIRPEEIERLRATQLELLQSAAPRLKPGGRLVYSTCSLEPQENKEVVKEFLREHPDFKLEIERELLPFQDGVDGAYVARLRLDCH
ncbi:MAG: 16S rRNA (cytosine(967)-C(5))-methyltransferase RsmB [Verrucomicrobiota bacterium]